MRAISVLLMLIASAGATAGEISDEFKLGFGGVPWGMDLADLMTKFPGGIEAFSTAPGGIDYVLSMDDPVLGIERRGLYVHFFIGKDGSVYEIATQIPYDQTSTLLSKIISQLGEPKWLEIQGISTIRGWPADHGLVVGMRTTGDRKYMLTEFSVTKAPQESPARQQRANHR